MSSNEWYTPARYIEAARLVMGSIDLDPASCELANETVKATRYYSKEDDGLSKPWKARNVWVNPPFTGTNSRQKWTKKIVEEYREGHIEQGILLIPVALDTQWFQALWEFPICFPSFRICFYQGKTHHNNPNFGVCFVYLGPYEQTFTEVFSRFGRVVKAIDTPRTTVIEPELWEVSA